MKWVPDMSTYLTTAALSAVEHGTSVTSDDIVKAIRGALDRLCHEPIAEAMIRRGFDPARGGVLLIPPQYDVDMDRLPSYVKASPLVIQPLLIDVSSLDLTVPHEWYSI